MSQCGVHFSPIHRWYVQTKSTCLVPWRTSLPPCTLDPVLLMVEWTPLLLVASCAAAENWQAKRKWSTEKPRQDWSNNYAWFESIVMKALYHWQLQCHFVWSSMLFTNDLKDFQGRNLFCCYCQFHVLKNSHQAISSTYLCTTRSYLVRGQPFQDFCNTRQDTATVIIFVALLKSSLLLLFVFVYCSHLQDRSSSGLGSNSSPKP